MKRIIVTALIAVIAIAAIGSVADAKKKKKKVKVPVVGLYQGTNSEGIPLQISLTSKTTGTFNYCSEAIPFTIAGKAFTVAGPEPALTSATGAFSKKSVLSGVIQPNGCTASVTTYTLNPPHK